MINCCICVTLEQNNWNTDIYDITWHIDWGHRLKTCYCIIIHIGGYSMLNRSYRSLYIDWAVFADKVSDTMTVTYFQGPRMGVSQCHVHVKYEEHILCGMRSATGRCSLLWPWPTSKVMINNRSHGSFARCHIQSTKRLTIVWSTLSDL